MYFLQKFRINFWVSVINIISTQISVKINSRRFTMFYKIASMKVILEKRRKKREISMNLCLPEDLFGHVLVPGIFLSTLLSPKTPSVLLPFVPVSLDSPLFLCTLFFVFPSWWFNFKSLWELYVSYLSCKRKYIVRNKRTPFELYTRQRIVSHLIEDDSISSSLYNGYQVAIQNVDVV